MIRSERHRANAPTTASAVVWNTVVPALGLALILGAPMLPAIALAAFLSIATYGVLAHASQRRQWLSRVPGRAVPQRAARAN